MESNLDKKVDMKDIKEGDEKKLIGKTTNKSNVPQKTTVWSKPNNLIFEAPESLGSTTTSATNATNNSNESNDVVQNLSNSFTKNINIDENHQESASNDNTENVIGGWPQLDNENQNNDVIDQTVTSKGVGRVNQNNIKQSNNKGGNEWSDAKPKPKEGYSCKICGKQGGEPDSHWFQLCPKGPYKYGGGVGVTATTNNNNSFNNQQGYWSQQQNNMDQNSRNNSGNNSSNNSNKTYFAPPKKGYVCKFCGKQGGEPDSHWFQQCPFMIVPNPMEYGGPSGPGQFNSIGSMMGGPPPPGGMKQPGMDQQSMMIPMQQYMLAYTHPSQLYYMQAIQHQMSTQAGVNNHVGGPMQSPNLGPGSPISFPYAQQPGMMYHPGMAPGVNPGMQLPPQTMNMQDVEHQIGGQPSPDQVGNDNSGSNGTE